MPPGPLPLPSAPNSRKPASKSAKAPKIKKEKEIKTEVKQEKITDSIPVKKKRDRFNGMTEEEVLKRTLPDLLVPNLDIMIVSTTRKGVVRICELWQV